MTDAPEKSLTDRKLEQVIADYLRQKDAGLSVNVESLCDANPDIAAELRSYIAGERLLDDLSDNGREVESSESDTSESAMAETMRPGASRGTNASIAGRMIGRFKLLRELGAGAMGAVYLAEDTALGRQVALKVPTIATTDGSEFSKRFRREAQAAAKLSHPAICPVFDIGEDNGVPFIAMAYIDGQPLSRFVGTEEYRDQRRVAEVAVTIAEALYHAHEAGIIHRDLKPGNVLVDETGFPVVTDFGLARFVGDDDTRLTQEGHILGTPAYMSPEQVEGDPTTIGPATDIYALGVMLYELLSGHLPFRGSLASMLAQIVRDRVPHPSQHRQDIDSRLADLALEMLEKDPNERPDSMREVAERLNSWLDETSPESVVEQEKRRRIVDKLEASKQQIELLLRKGHFAKAVSALEKISALRSPHAAEYVAWAKEKIPEVKSLPRKLRENLPHLLETARKLIRRHDYTQAVEMLQQVPESFRSPEMQKVLDDALELQDESDLLLAALKQCVRSQDYNGIEDNLKRFLELKPGNRFAQELQESLESYRNVPVGRRRYRHGDRGELLPYRRSASDNWLLWGALCFFLVFGLMTWGVTVYLRSDTETLYVTVLDESLLEDGALTLTIDGNETVINGLDEHVSITPGEHGYEISHGDTLIAGPAKMTIVSDGRNALEIGRVATPLVPLLTNQSHDGWTELFNGHDLMGWEIMESSGPRPNDQSLHRTSSGGWEVDETGVLVCTTDRPGWLKSIHEFGDFELQLEFNVPLNGNSGILIRCPDQGHLSRSGMEVQVVDPRLTQGPQSQTRMGGIVYSGLQARGGASKPAGEWNEMTIRCLGEEIEIVLNGTTVYEVMMNDDTELRDRPRNGHIGLYNWMGKAHGTRFRKIRIRELSASADQGEGAWTGFFNGKDLTGLKTAGPPGSAENWQVQNGMLVGIGSESICSIFSTKTFDDFELEFDYQLPSAGNSGVWFRTPNNNEVGFKNATQAMHVSLIDDKADRWKRYVEIPSHRSGGLHGVVAPNPIVEPPPDEWHHFSMRAIGSTVTATINGTQVLDVDLAREAVRLPSAPGLKRMSGYIGLEDHGGGVQFRNIQIRELDQ